MTESISILNKMTMGTGLTDILKFIKVNLKNLLEGGVGIILLIFVDIYHFKNKNGVSIREKIDRYNILMRWCIYIVFLLVILIFGAYGISGLNQFAYFRF